MMKILYNFISFIFMSDERQDKEWSKDLPPDDRPFDEQTWDVGGKTAWYGKEMFNKIKDNRFAQGFVKYNPGVMFKNSLFGGIKKVTE